MKTCTLEQAKRLKELGVEQTSEWCWCLYPALGSEYQKVKQHPTPKDAFATFDTDELLAMLPEDLMVGRSKQGEYHVYYREKIGKVYTTGYAGHCAAQAIADIIIGFLEIKDDNPSLVGFTIAEINERIKKYNS